MIAKFYALIQKNIYEAALILSGSAVLASLVLSEVVELNPCTLCWYQRILMFPIPLITAAAIIRSDKLAYIYVLPLSIIGLLISGYQSLLQWGVITEEVSSCSLTGPACGEPDILWFGFLTIPFGSFMIFLATTVLMFIASNKNKLGKSINEKKTKLVLNIFAVLILITGLATLIIRTQN